MRFLIVLFTVSLSISGFSQKPELTVQLGHSQLIYDVTYSYDGKMVATASADRTVKIWDQFSGREIRTFYIESGYATSVCFSKDSKRILIGGGSYDIGLVQEFEVKTGIQTKQFAGHTEYAWTVRYSPDNQFVYSASFDGTLVKWDYRTAQKLFVHERYDNYRSMDITSDGKYIVVTNDSDSCNVQVFKTKNLDVYKTIELPKMFDVQKIDISDDDTKIVLGDFSGSIAICELENPTPSLIASPRSDIIYAIHFLDNENVLVGYDYGHLIKWDINKNELAGDLIGHKERIYGIDISPTNGTVITAGSFEKACYEWDLESLKLKKKYVGKVYPARYLELSEDGNNLMSSHFDFFGGNVNFWNLNKTSPYHLVSPQGRRFKYGQLVSDSIFYSNGMELYLRGLIDKEGKELILNANAADVRVLPSNNKVYALWQTGTWDSRSYTIYEMDIATKQIKNFLGSSFEECYNVTMANSSDRLYLTVQYSDTVCYYDVTEGTLNLLLTEPMEYWSFYSKILDVSSTNRTLFRYGKFDVEILDEGFQITDSIKTQEITKTNGLDEIKNVHCINDSILLIVGGSWSSGFVLVYDLKSKTLVQSNLSYNTEINDVAYDLKRHLIYLACEDGKIRIVDAKTLNEIASLISFSDAPDSWAVVHKSGLFDGSSEAFERQLYFSYEGEIIELAQIKNLYHEPGLLQDLRNEETGYLRSVDAFENLSLYPTVDLNKNGDQLELIVHERNGGIGPIQLFVNNKIVEYHLEEKLANGHIVIDLSKYNHRYLTNDTNTIYVITSNADESILSAPAGVQHFYKSSLFGDLKYDPQLHALFIGTSDYKGDRLDLKYASKDAEKLADAIKKGARNLFEDRVTIHQLTSDEKNLDRRPSKENILKALKELQENTRPEDIVIIYFSGHGVAYGQKENEFFYLTQDMRDGDLSDPLIRKSYTISSTELIECLNNMPALKQLLILDACSSGEAIKDLSSETKGVEASRVKALDRMKDQTGLFILAGSAADKVSYEASQFGQGLLTYALLKGMNVESAKSEGYLLDIMSWLKFTKSEVPILAESIGGIQEPQVDMPRNLSTFYVSIIPPKDQIDLASERPIFINSVFMNVDEHEDYLGIATLVNSKLQAISDDPEGLVYYVESDNWTAAHTIKGIYRIKEDKIIVECTLREGEVKIKSAKVEGQLSQMEQVVDQILGQLIKSE